MSGEGLSAEEPFARVVYLVKWIVLGAIIGVLAGVASAVFLKALDWATRTREAHGWLLFILPLAGFVVGLSYHYGGGRSIEGNNLIIDEIHEPKAWIPRRMAPLIFVGTIITHLFGGSAGARALRSRCREASPRRRSGRAGSRRPIAACC